MEAQPVVDGPDAAVLGRAVVALVLILVILLLPEGVVPAIWLGCTVLDLTSRRMDPWPSGAAP